MRLKTKLLLLLYIALMIGVATPAFADLSCAVTTVPTARGIVNGHWENTGDLTFTCVAPTATPTTDTSITVFYGGLTITNTPTLPAGHAITVTNTSGALGASLDTTRSDTGTTGVSNAGSLIAITIPAQAVPAAGTFVVKNVLVSLSGFITAGQSVSANINVISQSGNVSLTGTPVVVISAVLPALSSTTNPPALVPGTGSAQFASAGTPLPPDANCSTTACLDSRATFAVTVSEDHVDSWRGPFQYYSNGNGITTNGTNVLFTFSGMLPGSILANCVVSLTSGSLFALTGSGIAGAAGTTTLVVEIISDTDLTAIDTMTLKCGSSQTNPAYLPGASTGSATAPIVVNMRPFPTGTALPGPGGTAATTGGTPRYGNGLGTVGPVTVISFGPVVAITGITPSTGFQGSTVNATISGTNLSGASAVTFSGSGVTATIGSGATSTSLPVTVSIGSTASVGLRTLTVTTLAGGTSSPFGGFIVAGSVRRRRGQVISVELHKEFPSSGPNSASSMDGGSSGVRAAAGF